MTTAAARPIVIIDTTYFLALADAIRSGCKVEESTTTKGTFTITAPDGRQLRTFAGPAVDGALTFRAAYHLPTYVQAWRGLDTVREFAAGAH